MKRLFAIALLIIFSLQFAGVHIYFSFRLSGVTSERLQAKPGRSVYDLNQRTDEVVVSEPGDDDRDNLMSFFHSVFKRSHKDRKRVPPTAVKLLTLKYLTSAVILEFSEAQVRVAYTAYLLQYDSLTKPLDTPPPRA